MRVRVRVRVRVWVRVRVRVWVRVRERVRVRVRLRLGVRRARQLCDAVEGLEEQGVARLEQERGLHLGAHLDWEY